jgi:hypothetical protein
MKNIFVLLTLTISILPSAHAQDPSTNVNQVMIAQNYLVEYILDTRIGTGHKPIYQKTISISGQPEQNSQMNNVQLFFSTDALNNKKNPVLENTKLKVWYPMIEFESYYKMLQHKNGSMKITFIQNASQQKRRVEFVTNGNLPLLR